MITCDKIRHFALALPEVEERDHRGRPSFRVRNKIFITLWENIDRAVLKLSMADQSLLVANNSETFSLTSWGHQGWTNVELSRVDEEQLYQLVTSAWENVAPARLKTSNNLIKKQ